MPERILRNWTDSRKFENLSAESERLFIRVIMSADDFGRFHGDSRLIKAACFPLHDHLRTNEVDRWLDELSTRQLILRYEVCERKLIAIVNFRQRLRTVRAKFPPPEGKASDWLASDGDPLAHVGNPPQSAADCGQTADNPPQCAASIEEKRREIEEKRREGEGEEPPPTEPIENLILKINTIKLSWAKSPHMTQVEMHDLHKNKTGMLSLPAETWEDLRIWAQSHEGLEDWSMKTRSRFVGNYTEAVMKATEWKTRGGTSSPEHLSLGGRKPHSETIV